MRAFFWISEDWGWISPQRVTRFNLVERLSNHSHAEVVEYPDVTFEDSILRGWRCRRPASRAATRLPPMWSSRPRVSGSGPLRPNPPDPAVHRRWILVDHLLVLEQICQGLWYFARIALRQWFAEAGFCILIEIAALGTEVLHSLEKVQAEAAPGRRGGVVVTSSSITIIGVVIVNSGVIIIIIISDEK